jgi:DNA-binding PadR family transcriptional regulator
MHPYEAATTLRQRSKHHSVRLNYGSLYAVVESLERRGLIEAVATQREGRLPERTVYRLTNAGEVEAQDWLSELVSTPVKEYPAFEAALSFLPALPHDQAGELLEERAGHLEFEIAQAEAVQEMMQKHALPRLFRIEAEYSLALKRTELEFVRTLASEIRAGSLEGSEWWQSVHHGPDDAIAYPRDWDYSIGGKEQDNDN